jgi:hypothetical protein
VHVDDRVEQVGVVVERLVAQDAGVVDDDVDRAERLDRGGDDGLAALGGGDAVAVGDGLAAEGLDLADHVVGRTLAAAVARHRATEVVHDDARAAAGELERVRPAQAAAGAGDDRDLAVESDVSH